MTTGDALSLEAPGMAGQIAAFGRILRSFGLPSHPAAVLDACRAAAALDLQNREEFYWALRANFASDRGQYPAFDRAFHSFWDEGLGWTEEATEAPRPPVSAVQMETLASDAPEGSEERRRKSLSSGGASPEELLLKKDLRHLSPEDEPKLSQALQLLLSKLFTRPGRRQRPSFRGPAIEFRRTLRKSLRSHGELITLVRRERKPGRRKIALLGDVSGSMDVYGRFFLHLAHGIARLEPAASVYAFSTRLFRITELVRHLGAGAILQRLQTDTTGWSGGTRMGECLKEFNEVLRRGAHLRDTVVVIFSDGWDRGDPALLRREIVRLKGGAARVYWLNPLKGDPDYRPLCRGMSTALPYLDGFFAAHNVESLARFARLLARAR